jgi:hypothetical protein
VFHLRTDERHRLVSFAKLKEFSAHERFANDSQAKFSGI